MLLSTIFLFVGALRFIYPTNPINKTMHAPDQLRMTCSGTGDISTKVHWIRNNSEGVSVDILSTTFEFLPFLPNMWRSELQNKPPKEKFPYTYQCVASHPCHPDVISKPYTVHKKGVKNNPPSGLKMSTRPGGMKMQNLNRTFNSNFAFSFLQVEASMYCCVFYLVAVVSSSYTTPASLKATQLVFKLFTWVDFRRSPLDRQIVRW